MLNGLCSFKIEGLGHQQCFERSAHVLHCPMRCHILQPAATQFSSELVYESLSVCSDGGPLAVIALVEIVKRPVPGQ